MASDLSSFGKGIDLAIESVVSPEELRALIRDAAEDLLAAAEAEIRAAGGGAPGHITLFNGRPVQDLSRIDPDEGTITFRFEPAGVPVDVVQAVLDLLRANSPVLTGAYRASHRVFADDRDVTDIMPIAAEEAEKVDRWKIQPIIVYGRKLEEDRKRRGSDGVYEAVAAMAGPRDDGGRLMWRRFMSVLFPHRVGIEARDRLDASVAGHASATEAVSRAATEARAASRADRRRVDVIAREATVRVGRQEERRRHRLAQLEALKGALERNR